MPDKAKKARYESTTPEFPEVKYCSYLLEYLSDLGYASIGMNGYISLSFQEINSYIQSIGVKLDAWECVWLKELSTAYVNESYDKSPTKFAPYSSGKYTFSSDNAILAAFSGLGKSE